MLTDLGSTNGTFVTGERISGSVVLEDGARINIGSYTLNYHRRSEDSPDPAFPLRIPT